MWKSYGFPQVNQQFQKFAPLFSMHKSMHKTFRNQLTTVLRHHVKFGNQSMKKREKVRKNTYPPISHPAEEGDCQKNL